MQNAQEMQQMQYQQPDQQQMQGQMPQQMMNQQQMQLMQNNGGGIGGQGFSAKPQVIRQKRYRDPYREYVKVAPQNLMYDRRVVRGNTFAALVIPVNMQPDPALVEKQKMEEAYMRQRQDEIRRRRQEDQFRQQQMQENQQNMQMQQMQSGNAWEELSDHHNMVDEMEIEPDYYIDRPPQAVLIPNAAGDPKQTQIWDQDPDLFDYENEVEPILQVLVGKSIEHARIEIIEQYENQQLAKHKKQFLQLKEAELMETQRLEEQRTRKNDEIDRRNLQQRTAKNNAIQAEKKLAGKIFAKDFLVFFKRDTMNGLVDLGALRKPVDNSTGTIYIPQLYKQIKTDMQTHFDHQGQMDEILNNCMKKISRSHKNAMVQEINKRQEKKKEELRRKREAEEEQQKRKQKRAALRERHRIGLLKEQIQKELMGAAKQEDYSQKMKIYDVKDAAATDDGIIVIGGIIGELVITFTCLLDYILASPSNQNFMFTVESIEAYLADLICADDSQFPNNLIQLNINQSLEEISDGAELVLDQISKIVRDPAYLTDFGLNFIFEIQKDLVLNYEVIDILYRTLCKIATAPPKDLKEVPAAPEGATPEELEKLEEEITAIKAENEQTEKDNQRLTKLKTKIQVNVKPAQQEDNESVCIRVNNHRVPPVGADGQPIEKVLSEGGSGGEDFEPFDPAKVPTKIPLMRPVNPETNLNTIVYHSEAPYSLRKILIEKAQIHFKELGAAEIPALLTHSNQRTQMLYERFEDMLCKKFDFGRGCSHHDLNSKFLFKTFLQE